MTVLDTVGYYVSDGENGTKLESVLLSNGEVITVLRDQLGFEVAKAQSSARDPREARFAIQRNEEVIYEDMGWNL